MFDTEYKHNPTPEKFKVKLWESINYMIKVDLLCLNLHNPFTRFIHLKSLN